MKRVNLLFEIEDEISNVTVEEIGHYYHIHAIASGLPILKVIKRNRGHLKLPPSEEYLKYLLEEVEMPQPKFIPGQNVLASIDDVSHCAEILSVSPFSA